MIGVLDYGVGNVNAFANIYRSLDIEFNIAREPSEIRKASKLILPGVGSFDWAMKKLSISNFVQFHDKILFLKSEIVKSKKLAKCAPIFVLLGKYEVGDYEYTVDTVAYYEYRFWV